MFVAIYFFPPNHLANNRVEEMIEETAGKSRHAESFRWAFKWVFAKSEPEKKCKWSFTTRYTKMSPNKVNKTFHSLHNQMNQNGYQHANQSQAHSNHKAATTIDICGK